MFLGVVKDVENSRKNIIARHGVPKQFQKKGLLCGVYPERKDEIASLRFAMKRVKGSQ
jgi:hypothetical protein